MARTSVPDALAMRRLKYGEAPDAEREAVAQTLIAADRLAEAWLLYERRPGAPLVGTLRKEALRRGQTFLLLAMRRAGNDIADDELREAARAAEAAGRFLDARHAWVALGADDELRRIADQLPPRLRPAAEEPPSE
ncbi:MAG: hypothetical protein H6806_09680 [Planctomycetes bacterium]|nr:hypothetical protein [Planctomycetota bacterium]MCB9825735.1 hypothetical protein [Planctomycetota bacterium]MCB9830015.1 hypothetical protein [Planctomycetota bacterium]